MVVVLKVLQLTLAVVSTGLVIEEKIAEKEEEIADC